LLSVGLDQESASTALVPMKSSASPDSVSQDYLKRCNMKIVERRPVSKSSDLPVRPGEKPTGFVPVIAFEVLESGEVVNAHVQRSSGFANQDAYALESIKSTRYNNRPGCGIIHSEGSVLIHYR